MFLYALIILFLAINRKTKDSGNVGGDISQIYRDLNFIVRDILIIYWLSQIFDLCLVLTTPAWWQKVYGR
jgi:hypothetical protein